MQSLYAFLIPHPLNAKTKQHKLTLIGMEAEDDDGQRVADVPVIGGYEGLPLNFYGHDVFKTVLSLHSY